jgi:hypothetical protein
LRYAREQARDSEAGNAGQEESTTAEEVTEASGRDQSGGEGQHVAGDDPPYVGGVGVQLALNGRKGNVDHGAVEQVHQRRESHDCRYQARSGCAGRGLDLLNDWQASVQHVRFKVVRFSEYLGSHVVW